MGQKLRVLARVTAAASVVGLCAAAAVAAGQSAPGVKRVRVDRIALSLDAKPGRISVRTRPLQFEDGAVYELVASGRGEGIGKAGEGVVCYDVLYVFDCDSRRAVRLHDRFALAGRPLERFLTRGPSYAAGFALLYQYRSDHTYSFLLQKRRGALALVQTCVFAPPSPCLGPAPGSLPDEGALRVSFSTAGESTSKGSFTITVDRLRPLPSPASGSRNDAGGSGTTLPGMAPQTPRQALAIIQSIVVRNAHDCTIRKWDLSVSGFPADWGAKAALVIGKRSATAVASWAITETKLIPTNALAVRITAGCPRG